MTNVKERAPTLEEFTALVKEYLEQTLTHISADELDRYMNDAETKETIKGWYDYDLARYHNGELTYMQFVIGCASGAGYALDLMY